MHVLLTTNLVEPVIFSFKMESEGAIEGTELLSKCRNAIASLLLVTRHPTNSSLLLFNNCAIIILRFESWDFLNCSHIRNLGKCK